MLKKYILYIALSAAAFSACEQPKDKKTGNALDTPTTGTLRVMVDEGYKPIVETSIDVFDSTYKLAKIEPVYTSEAEAVGALIRDSVQVIVITRQLSAEELKFFEQRGFKPYTTAIAHDAVGFVLNPTNKDTLFTVDQVRDILTGKISKWSQINPKSGLGDIRIVFDNPLSGTVRYCKDSIAGGVSLPPNASALKTNQEVINYVSKQKNALGIISSNWISDTDDKGVQNFLKEIRLVDIAAKSGEEGYGPYQAYLALGKYPFRRTLYVINAQARKGLGLGFSSFLAGPHGQRIVLKDGLLPATAPTRLMKVQRE